MNVTCRLPSQVVVEGRQQPGSCLFLVSTADSCTSLLGVEEFAIQHYRLKEAWPRAVHGEGATFSLLFMLLMWEVVFSSSVADVFRGAFQVRTLSLKCL